MNLYIINVVFFVFMAAIAPTKSLSMEPDIYGTWFEYIGQLAFRSQKKITINNNSIKINDLYQSVYVLQTDIRYGFKFKTENGLKYISFLDGKFLLLYNDIQLSPTLFLKENTKTSITQNSRIRGTWCNTSEKYGMCMYKFDDYKLIINCDNGISLVADREHISNFHDSYYDAPVFYRPELLSKKLAILYIITPRSTGDVLVLKRCDKKNVERLRK